MNRLRSIQPYWNGAMWCFDDPQHGIRSEPFVAGASEIIDGLVERAGLPRRKKFALVFSDHPFPGYQITLLWDREEFEGDWYRLENDPQTEGWLCPVLRVYFPAAPEALYCEARGLQQED